jgi:hypothetical protein
VSIEPREFLNSLLEGADATGADLSTLIKCEEGQHLEFKDGKVTQKEHRSTGRHEIREAINGFANAEGGILVLGYSDRKPRKLTPCTRPGNEPIDKWCEGIIHDMAAFLSPPPRFQVLSNGKVLLVAVPRAPRLVPLLFGGELKYFLRLNQSTLEIPTYLLNDLLLGRRQRPAVRLLLKGVRPHGMPRSGPCQFKYHLEVLNDGLVEVEHVQVGIIGWSSSRTGTVLNPYLRTFVDLESRPKGTNWSAVHLVAKAHYPNEETHLAPFSSRHFRTSNTLDLPAQEAMVSCAVYVLPRGAEPLWFQTEFRVAADDNGRWCAEAESLKPSWTKRPTLRWAAVRQ